MNYMQIRKYMDMAAEKLDRQGHKDLADKVDHYCAKLKNANERQRKLIARVLRRIDAEATKREGRTAYRRPITRATAGRKSAAIRIARRKLALRKKIEKRRRMAKLVDKYKARKAAAGRGTSLRTSRKARLNSAGSARRSVSRRRSR